MPPARTPEIKRVRSLFLSASTLPGTVTNDSAVTHMWEDDVKVIGVLIINEIYLVDGNTNEDEDHQLITEVSRSAIWAQNGCLARKELQAHWNGVIYIGGATRGELLVMFPEGHGIDFDEGEYINMLYSHQITATVDSKSFHNAIVYYVER